MGKYLRFYNKYMHKGRLPLPGLCNCLIGIDDIFNPSKYDLRILISEGKSSAYWGSELILGESSRNDRAYIFNPLRQNIVLFMAAMSGEFDKPKRKRR